MAWTPQRPPAEPWRDPAQLAADAGWQFLEQHVAVDGSDLPLLAGLALSVLARCDATPPHAWLQQRIEKQVRARPMPDLADDDTLARVAAALEAPDRLGADWPSVDTLLCCAAEAARRSPAARLQLMAPLRRALFDRLDAPGTALERAQRLLAACACGFVPDALVDALVASQQHDGGWPAAARLAPGRPPVGLGSRTLVSVFAAAALAEARP